VVWPWPDEVKCPTMDPSLVDPGVEADARGDTTLCFDTLRPSKNSHFLEEIYRKLISENYQHALLTCLQCVILM
jgi:hypothetical protein